MRLSDEVLMAYADGELDGPVRDEVQQVIASDPEVARRIAAHEALRRSVEKAFAGVLNEPVPTGLVATALRQSPPASSPAGALDPGSAQILPLRRKPRARPSLARWSALAASFLLGVVVWQLIRPEHGPLIAQRAGQLIANGALAQALSHQLVQEQSLQSGVRIGISFRSKSGNYCRTFQLQHNSYAGMACRAGGLWQIQMLGQIESAGAHAGGYRQAGSAVPSWLAQQVGNVIAGEPLDASAEASARANGWN